MFPRERQGILTQRCSCRAGGGGCLVGGGLELSGRRGERSDVVERVEVVAVAGPAGGKMKRPVRGHGESGGRGTAADGGAGCGRRGRSCPGARAVASSAAGCGRVRRARSTLRWRRSRRRGSARARGL